MTDPCRYNEWSGKSRCMDRLIARGRSPGLWQDTNGPTRKERQGTTIRPVAQLGCTCTNSPSHKVVVFSVESCFVPWCEIERQFSQVSKNLCFVANTKQYNVATAWWHMQGSNKIKFIKWSDDQYTWILISFGRNSIAHDVHFLHIKWVQNTCYCRGCPYIFLN